MATARTYDDYLGEGALADRYRSLWLDQRAVLDEAGHNSDSWKRAAHEIWHSQPRQLRRPQTEKELSVVLGVPARTLRDWKQKHPDRYAAGLDAAKQLVSEWLPDVMWAAIDNAINGAEKGAADRRLLAEVGGLKPSTGVDVTSGGAPLKTYSILAHPDMWDDAQGDPPG